MLSGDVPGARRGSLGYQAVWCSRDIGRVAQWESVRFTRDRNPRSPAASCKPFSLQSSRFFSELASADNQDTGEMSFSRVLNDRYADAQSPHRTYRAACPRRRPDSRDAITKMAKIARKPANANPCWRSVRPGSRPITVPLPLQMLRPTTTTIKQTMSAGIMAWPNSGINEGQLQSRPCG